jgi:hypothetical protein
VIFIDFDGDLIDILTPTLTAYSELVLGPYSVNISAGFHWISATCLTISGGLAGRDQEYFKWIWGSTKEDITGTFEFDPWLVQPDFKVDIKDVATAAKAFGSYPGHPRWSTVADINGDYKIDIKDIAAIAKKFGWTG